MTSSLTRSTSSRGAARRPGRGRRTPCGAATGQHGSSGELRRSRAMGRGWVRQGRRWLTLGRDHVLEAALWRGLRRTTSPRATTGPARPPRRARPVRRHQGHTSGTALRRFGHGRRCVGRRGLRERLKAEGEGRRGRHRPSYGGRQRDPEHRRPWALGGEVDRPVGRHRDPLALGLRRQVERRRPAGATASRRPSRSRSRARSGAGRRGRTSRRWPSAAPGRPGSAG